MGVRERARERRRMKEGFGTENGTQQTRKPRNLANRLRMSMDKRTHPSGFGFLPETASSLHRCWPLQCPSLTFSCPRSLTATPFRPTTMSTTPVQLDCCYCFLPPPQKRQQQPPRQPPLRRPLAWPRPRAFSSGRAWD